MPDKAWKAFERRVAKSFGGRRRGPVVKGENGEGLNDIDIEYWSIECKKYKQPFWGTVTEALKQAKNARAQPEDIPVAVIAKNHSNYDLALVCITLHDFEKILHELDGGTWLDRGTWPSTA